MTYDWELNKKKTFSQRNFLPQLITTSTSTAFGFDMKMTLHHHPPHKLNVGIISAVTGPLTKL